MRNAVWWVVDTLLSHEAMLEELWIAVNRRNWHWQQQHKHTFFKWLHSIYLFKSSTYSERIQFWTLPTSLNHDGHLRITSFCSFQSNRRKSRNYFLWESTMCHMLSIELNLFWTWNIPSSLTGESMTVDILNGPYDNIWHLICSTDEEYDSNACFHMEITPKSTFRHVKLYHVHWNSAVAHHNNINNSLFSLFIYLFIFYILGLYAFTPLSVWAGRQDSGTNMRVRFLNFSAITAIQFLTSKFCYGFFFFFWRKTFT